MGFRCVKSALNQFFPGDKSASGVSLLPGWLLSSTVKPDFLIDPEGTLPGIGLHAAQGHL